MKTIEMTKELSLTEVVRQAQKEDVVLTRRGHAVALISDYDDDDLEWYAQEHDPEFLASLKTARLQIEKGQFISHEDLMRELGLDNGKKSANNGGSRNGTRKARARTRTKRRTRVHGGRNR